MWWYERKILLTWRWSAFICACIHANIHHPCMHAVIYPYNIHPCISIVIHVSNHVCIVHSSIHPSMHAWIQTCIHHPSTHLHIYPWFMHAPSVYLSIHASIKVSIYPLMSVSLFVCLYGVIFIFNCGSWREWEQLLLLYILNFKYEGLLSFCSTVWHNTD